MTALIDPDEMARRFGVPKSTVLQWNRDHGWPHIRVGKRIRWDEEQFAEIKRRHETATTKQAPKSLPGQTPRSASRGRKTA